MAYPCTNYGTGDGQCKGLCRFSHAPAAYFENCERNLFSFDSCQQWRGNSNFQRWILMVASSMDRKDWNVWQVELFNKVFECVLNNETHPLHMNAINLELSRKSLKMKQEAKEIHDAFTKLMNDMKSLTGEIKKAFSDHVKNVLTDESINSTCKFLEWNEEELASGGKSFQKLSKSVESQRENWSKLESLFSPANSSSAGTEEKVRKTMRFM